MLAADGVPVLVGLNNQVDRFLASRRKEFVESENPDLPLSQARR